MQIDLTPDTLLAADAAPVASRELANAASPRTSDTIARLYGDMGRPQAVHVSACDDEGFAAGLRRLAEKRPEAIFEAIAPQADGSCRVTLHTRDAYGQPYAVQLTVTHQDVADNVALRGIAAEPHDADAPVWHVVLEEAYSWLRVMTMPRGSSAAQCRAELDRTSSMEEVLFVLTGRAEGCLPHSDGIHTASAAQRPARLRTRAGQRRTLH